MLSCQDMNLIIYTLQGRTEQMIGWGAQLLCKQQDHGDLAEQDMKAAEGVSGCKCYLQSTGCEFKPQCCLMAQASLIYCDGSPD